MAQQFKEGILLDSTIGGSTLLEIENVDTGEHEQEINVPVSPGRRYVG
jgi:hypothetical protein